MESTNSASRAVFYGDVMVTARKTLSSFNFALNGLFCVSRCPHSSHPHHNPNIESFTLGLDEIFRNLGEGDFVEFVRSGLILILLNDFINLAIPEEINDILSKLDLDKLFNALLRVPNYPSARCDNGDTYIVKLRNANQNLSEEDITARLQILTVHKDSKILDNLILEFVKGYNMIREKNLIIPEVLSPIEVCFTGNVSALAQNIQEKNKI